MPETLSPTLGLPMVDLRCDFWESCKGEKRAYRVVASCGNCQTRVVLLMTFGHDFPGYPSGPECPSCGMRRWSKVGLEDQQAAPVPSSPEPPTGESK